MTVEELYNILDKKEHELDADTSIEDYDVYIPANDVTDYKEVKSIYIDDKTKQVIIK